MLQEKLETAPDAPGTLVCLALKGDRAAQYRMGEIREQGLGLPVDLKKAVYWYKLSATPDTGSTPVYIAPVGNQSYGWVMNVKTGLSSAGYPPAQLRLAELYLAGRGVKQSEKKAQKWLRRAARQGYAPAIRRLEAFPAE